MHPGLRAVDSTRNRDDPAAQPVPGKYGPFWEHGVGGSMVNTVMGEGKKRQNLQLREFFKL